MHRNSLSQIPTPPSLQPLSSVQTKIWHIISLTFTIGGLALMGWGGWLFLQNQIEASQPPPARILEVGPADLNKISRQPNIPAAETNLDQDTFPKRKPAAISALAAPTVPSLVDNPLLVLAPETTAPVEAEPASPSTEFETAGETAPPETQPEPAATLEPVAETVPSLADNPLPVIEPQEAVQPPPESATYIGPIPTIPPATAPPTRMVADSINLDADVVTVGWKTVTQNGQPTNVWEVADYAAGWHKNSALPGQGGNVVLSGHNNIKGEVFRYLEDLEPGDVITLYADSRPYQYAVSDKFIVKDKGEPETVRRANARWIGPFTEERLTLVTCWPYNNNTHRLIVIAHPISKNGA